MHATEAQAGAKRAGFTPTDCLGTAALLAAGAALAWACAAHPASLPPWAPWDFSWTEFLAATLALWWYGRGLARTPAPARPARPRRAAFIAGVVLIYAVLQTRAEYMAEHMFLLNRVQHLVMHHIGPLLIALAWPGETLRRGMPAPLRRATERPVLTRTVAAIQQPVLAGALFVGILFFWLIPQIHFRAMLDPQLYAVMNGSMVIDGILFWCLLLDPRPSPPARLSPACRFILAMAVQVPQIAGGAFIAIDRHDLYAYYALCGRVLPGIGAHADQQIGGFIVAFLGGMTGAAAALILFARILAEGREEEAPHTPDAARPEIPAA